MKARCTWCVRSARSGSAQTRAIAAGLLLRTQEGFYWSHLGWMLDEEIYKARCSVRPDATLLAQPPLWTGTLFLSRLPECSVKRILLAFRSTKSGVVARARGCFAAVYPLPDPSVASACRYVHDRVSPLDGWPRRPPRASGEQQRMMRPFFSSFVNSFVLGREPVRLGEDVTERTVSSASELWLSREAVRTPERGSKLMAVRPRPSPPPNPFAWPRTGATLET
eukprot:149223-Pleurochrysis_carterae.AAC.1